MWNDTQNCPQLALSDYQTMAVAGWLKLGAIVFISLGEGSCPQSQHLMR